MTRLVRDLLHTQKADFEGQGRKKDVQLAEMKS